MTSVKRPVFQPLSRPAAAAPGAAQKASGRSPSSPLDQRDHELLDQVQVSGGFAPPLELFSYRGEDAPPAQLFSLGGTEDFPVESLLAASEAQLARGPGKSILVHGNVAFVERTLETLTALGATRAGKDLLEALDKVPHAVSIVETSDGNFAHAENLEAAWLREDGTPGAGCDATIHFNATREVIGGGTEPWMTRPPMVGLFHELRHAFFYATGQLQPGGTDGVFNRELAVLGYPYDADAKPETAPVDAPQPTENALRAELGLPLRPQAQANPVDNTPT